MSKWVKPTREPVVLVYYHSTDNDGYMSSAIVRRAWEKDPKAFPGKLFFVPYNRGKCNVEFLLEKLDVRGVIVADVQLPIEEAKKLYGMACDPNSDFFFVWIDHHVSAIDEYNEAGLQNVDGLRYRAESNTPHSEKKAACILTWEYFFPNEEMPKAVKLVSKYDVWDRDAETDYFSAGSRRYSFKMRTNLDGTEDEFHPGFMKLLDGDQEFFKELMSRGEIIEEYLATQFQRQKYRAFFGKIDGHPVLIANIPDHGSRPLEHCRLNRHADIIVTIGNDMGYKFGIYRHANAPSEFNVSEFAASMGGGGHADAAGWTLEGTAEFSEFLRNVQARPLRSDERNLL